MELLKTEPLQKSQFLLTTKRHCFICLKERTSLQALALLQDDVIYDAEMISLERLHRYLKLNFGRLIGGLISLSPGSPPILENTELKVELCQGCEMVVNSFSDLHEELERIQKELGKCISTISERFVKDTDFREYEQLKEKVGAFHTNIFEIVRNRTYEKCNAKLEKKPETTPKKKKKLLKSEELGPPPIVQPSTSQPSRIYSCRDCNLEFSSGQALVNHNKAKHLGIRHACNVCGLSFTQNSSLHRHFRRSHPNNECSTSATGETVKCHICEMNFGGASYLKMHIQRVHSKSKAKRVQCKCGKSYNHVSNLRLHQMRWCNLFNKKDLPTGRRRRDTPPPSTTQQLNKSSPTTTTANLDGRKKKRKLVNKTENNFGDEITTTTTGNENEDIKDTITCLTCGVICFKNTFKLHQKQFHQQEVRQITVGGGTGGGKAVQLVIISGGAGGGVGGILPNQNNMVINTKQQESGRNPSKRRRMSSNGPGQGQAQENSPTKSYTCPICQDELGTKQALEIHQNAKHLGIRYSCDICSATYTQKSSLKRHYNKSHPDMQPSYSRVEEEEDAAAAAAEEEEEEEEGEEGIVEEDGTVTVIQDVHEHDAVLQHHHHHEEVVSGEGEIVETEGEVVEHPHHEASLVECLEEIETFTVDEDGAVVGGDGFDLGNVEVKIEIVDEDNVNIVGQQLTLS